MPTSGFYAHTFGDDERDWEPLEDHLQAVAARAAEFAGKFGAADWGRLAGLWHDAGKYQPAFQARLRDASIHAPHAGAGATLAQALAPLAFAIAGHHAGLANLEKRECGPTPLKEVVRRGGEHAGRLDAAKPHVPAETLAAPVPALPPYVVRPPRAASAADSAEAARRRLEFFTRMLFSALVDADRVETAAFHDRAEGRTPDHDRPRYEPLDALRDRLDASVDAKGVGAASTPMNRLRAGVLRDCRVAAEASPGLFSLTVPTGGGKTLAAMSFALRHACRHGLDRVVVVIPFTSIIEQNARAYRDALGEDPARPETWNVLEHHSGVDEQARDDENSPREFRRKLAAENWDAPVVVTTTVQFFESLFSNRPGRCRKLHAVARSAIVLDEVQSLPPGLLRPILDGLKELTANYGCTVVLSTATPPALERREGFPEGLEGVRPIVDGAALAANPAARRVNVTWRTDAVVPYADLAAELAAERQALAIVHRRADARTLAELLPTKARFHLSALMCPAHRSARLKAIRERLRSGKPCRLVSTQLIEAGVDVDFPVVYRALAGVDSLAQSAGRCDREGRLSEAAGGPAGRLVVFKAETEPPAGTLRDAAKVTGSLLGMAGHDERLPDGLDLFDPAHAELFFRQFYGGQPTDRHGVQTERAELNFATVDLLFRMIDSPGRSVAVPWGDEGERRVAAFRAEPNRDTVRALQPYLVQVNQRYFDVLAAAGQLEPVGETLGLPTGLFGGLYDEEFGLNPTADGTIDPESLVI